MYESLIKELRSEFGQAVEYHKVKGITNEGWFLLEITPLPIQIELEQIVSDIENINPVGVQGGKLVHLECCEAHNHNNLQKDVRKALKDLKDQSFKVAVYAGLTNIKILKNQPIAVVLEPEISYITYPDHPHLNVGGFDPANGFYFPDSLCYIDDPQQLGETKKERLLNAFDQISIWLFRHQVWESSRKYKKRGIWIGPQVGSFAPYDYPPILDPNRACWCGSNKPYKDCHSESDLLALVNKEAETSGISLDQVKRAVIFNKLNAWEQRLRVPKQQSLNLLKRKLLSKTVT
ncbi:SEC-C metal-binding domain-containing protein [Schinkia azotoformans]|uniref:SEC-C metal-binding domain-containing protein n=1 Tax=Schinkia azotoformans TaxID=1454 RepID=UPI002DC01EBE|nr:SEC-C metal-binding domain-containing protein [Schinkia azotoformans]MEC1759899.1 SEC-C metal-binding domain-containing protein [Schinkia azotoformans]